MPRGNQSVKAERDHGQKAKGKRQKAKGKRQKAAQSSGIVILCRLIFVPMVLAREAMRRRTLRIALFFFVSVAGAEEWARFRGPNGSGVSNDTGFPAEFGKEKNLRWRTPARPGKSSPVLTRNHIFLTAFEKGKLFTQCFDRETGKLMWERWVERPRAESTEGLNHPAAITAVTDGENVYAFFMDFGLISYDGAGKVRWKVPLGPFSNSMGHSASPILAGDSIILVMDQALDSYIAAFDCGSGKMRWKTSRGKLTDGPRRWCIKTGRTSWY